MTKGILPHATSIDIPAGPREKSVTLLNACLADLAVLYTHAKHAHWNVKGLSFIALHELFDEIAGRVAGSADTVAERIVQLGGVAHGTAHQAVAATQLKEYDLAAVEDEQHVRALAHCVSEVGKSVRKAADTTMDFDLSTSDLFTEVSRSLDKDLWFLEAHLQGR